MRRRFTTELVALFGAVLALPSAGLGRNAVPVFVKSCGSARPDVEVCLLWNRKAQRGTLDLVFHGEDHETIDVTGERGDKPGIDWYVGYGKIQDRRLYLWLRVDDSGGLLPVTPRPPRTAALFYRQTPNQKWLPYPSSTQFLFSDIGR